MMLSVVHWRKYLLAREFDCFVDSTVAMTMISKQRHSSKLQRWGQLMQEYIPGMTIGYKRSKDNPADIFTRLHEYRQYVPQAANELTLEDSLYDHLYTLPTALRGSFDLLKPKTPADLSTLWGVAANEDHDETIAFMSQLNQDHHETSISRIFGGGGNDTKGNGNDNHMAFLAQLNAMKESIHQAAVDPMNNRLLSLERMICNQYFSPTTRVRTAAETRHIELVEHYGKYVQAFRALRGESPRILCVGDNQQRFAVGAELAGCHPVVHDDNVSIAELASKSRVSRDVTLWPSHNVHAIYANQRATLAAIANAADFMSAHHGEGVRVPVQVNDHGVPAAMNYRLEYADQNKPRGMLQWIEAAEELLAASQQGVDSDSVLSGNTHHKDSSVEHGELISAQLVAVFMHRAHGMPLITWSQAKENPSLAESLVKWADSGYQAMVTDANTDEVWIADAQQAEATGPMRILQRQGPPPQPRETPKSCSTTPLTFAERTERYEAARARVFGSMNATNPSTDARGGIPHHAYVRPQRTPNALRAVEPPLLLDRYVQRVCRFCCSVRSMRGASAV